MKTKKQEERIDAYLSQFEDAVRPLYYDIVLYLSELGYNPKKEKASISFKHELHTKQMAKMGTKVSKARGVFPFFSLRFLACRGYSQRFADIVRAYIVKYPTRAARCVDGGCDYCRGEVHGHVYAYTFPGGKTRAYCGAYAVEIPDMGAEDVAEIKKLIREEHAYLVMYEV